MTQQTLDNSAKLKEWLRLLPPGVCAASIWLVPLPLKPICASAFLLAICAGWVFTGTRDLPDGVVSKLPLLITAAAVALGLMPPLGPLLGTTLSLVGVFMLYLLERRARALPQAKLALRHGVTSRLMACYLVVYAYLVNPYF